MNLSATDSKLSVRHAGIYDHENIVDYFLNADTSFLISMGVDTSKLPPRQQWPDMLNANFELDIDQKKFFCMIWLADGKPAGHSNITKIVFKHEAYMHLHMWHGQARQKGYGAELLKLTLPYYFNTFKLENLFCEPAASNIAPNRTLERSGFDFVRSYETTPGWINSYQTVNRWVMTKEKFNSLFVT